MCIRDRAEAAGTNNVDFLIQTFGADFLLQLFNCLLYTSDVYKRQYYRTVATYILAAICTVWLEPNRYIVFGFLLIAASVLAKLFMSAEEKNTLR